MSAPEPVVDMGPYRAVDRERRAAREAALAERRERGWAFARRAAEVLRTEFGATRVCAFGSLVGPAAFHDRSDVDLAVWGLTSSEYWRALAALEGLDPEVELDLVRVEAARPALVETIEAEGEDL